MKTKYTPEQWMYDDELVIFTSDSDRIVNIALVDPYHELPDIEAEATAKFMAESPNMIARLLDVEAFLLNHIGIDQTIDVFSPKVLLQFVQEVIQKATS